jgi:hypothetical protein
MLHNIRTANADCLACASIVNVNGHGQSVMRTSTTLKIASGIYDAPVAGSGPILWRAVELDVDLIQSKQHDVTVRMTTGLDMRAEVIAGLCVCARMAQNGVAAGNPPIC